MLESIELEGRRLLYRCFGLFVKLDDEFEKFHFHPVEDTKPVLDMECVEATRTFIFAGYNSDP